MYYKKVKTAIKLIVRIFYENTIIYFKYKAENKFYQTNIKYD